MTEPKIAPEFSRPIAVDKLRDRGSDFAIEASAAERAALARRFAILGIDALTADLNLKPLGGGMVRLTGQVKARVHQACVVTLADVPQTIDEAFERLYAPGAVADEENDEVNIDFEGEEPPDPLVDGEIDIGEAAAEQVALALDPYPRAPGAVFGGAGDDDGRPNPFAALAALKKRE